MSNIPFFSTKISPGFKKFSTIFACISFVFLTLFVLFTWYVCSPDTSFNKEYVQRIIQENASRDVEGVDTNKADEEISSQYKEEISNYIRDIKVNLVIIDATFSYMEENPLESSPYFESLEVSMNECDFSKYPYSKEMFFPEELRTKVNNLEILTKSLCNTLAKSSKQILIFFDMEDITKMKDVYMDIYDMNEEAYNKRLVIDSTCEEIEELISL